MKENWLVAIKRTELSVEETKSKVVCSQHFTKDMYLDRPGTYKPRLKPDALPCIFSFPEVKTEGVRRGRRRKREPLAVALRRWGQKRNLEDPLYIPPKVNCFSFLLLLMFIPFICFYSCGSCEHCAVFLLIFLPGGIYKRMTGQNLAKI